MNDKSLSIPSTLPHLECIDPFVDAISNELHLSYAKSTKIKILLNEAVSNAMRHGNQLSPEKNVTICCRKKEDDDKVCFQICDEGEGFDFQNLPDPTSCDRLHEEGGRGVFLMKELSDELHYENNGSTVHIKFCV